MKICSKCKIEKEVLNFSKSGLYYNSWCNSCRAELERYNRALKGIKEKVKPIILDENHKECLKCHKILNTNKFNKSSRGRLERASYCKKCERQYHKELNVKNPEESKRKSRKSSQKYRNSHREYWRSLHRIHQFNRKNKIKAQSDGTITEKFMKSLYATENCYWCGKYTPIENRTAEHVIPLNKGGIHGVSNIEMACLSCNSSKLNFN